MLCASCGTENHAGSRFCDNCGSPLAATCPHCGQPNRSDARFCASCGLAMAGTRTDATATAPATRAPTAAATPTAEAERRLVTVLFTDLVGFTSLAEDRDPEAVRELLSSYFDTATRIVTLHGGTVEKFIGDAVMAVWGTPVAHEDDAERAVRAALELVDAVHALHPDLKARAGVLTGEAAVTLGAQNQGMVAGDLVNTAARLQGVAEPGTVLVGETTRRAAERSIVFEPLGDHSLKGKTSPVPAWRALRVVAAIGGRLRAEQLEPPFVGRDEELRQLKDQLHGVEREGRVRLVSITGPGGIGKSRLAWELQKYTDGLTQDVYWHSGRSPSYGEGITFWALGEMVRRRAGLAEDDDDATTRAGVAASVAEFIGDDDERERVASALLSLLGVEEAPAAGRDALFPAWRTFFERIAERGTTVLVFEDLQWADSGLLDFIDHLLDWARGIPMLVVTLARPELFDRRPDWGAGRRNVTALGLEALTDADVTELLAGLVPGLPEGALKAIVARAEGIPLYAVETVRGLLADGRIERRGDVYAPVGDLTAISAPESLRSLIASRLDALEGNDRSLLQDAAVLGQVFATDALAAISGVAVADLEPRLRTLVRRELLDVETDPRSPERGQHKFVQSLIREVAYGTLARRDRRARHLAVARHYEAVGDPALAGALANHYLAARDASEPGPEADAVATQARLALTAAAQRAASLGSYDQAVAYLEQALAVTNDPAERAGLLDRAAQAASAAASPEGQRFAIEAVEAYRSLGDRVAIAAATARLGKTLLDASEVDRALEVLEAAVPEAEAIDAPAVLAETLANLSRTYMRLGRGEDAVAAADRALPIAERLNLDAVVAEGLTNKGSAYNMLGRRREAIGLYRTALELIQKVGDDVPRNVEMRIRNNYASAVQLEDPPAAMALMLDTLALIREVGDRGMYNWVLGNIGVARLLEGHDWDEHVALQREAIQAATLRTDRARLRILLGLFDVARDEGVAEMVAEIRELTGDGTGHEERFNLHMAKSEAGFVVGDFRTAFDEAWALAQTASQGPEIPLGAALRAAACARTLDRTLLAAERIAELPYSDQFGQVLRLSAEAAVAALQGRPADALAGFRQARAIQLRLGQPVDAAQQTLMIAAHVLPGEPEVRAWIEEIRPLLEELRANGILKRLDAALAQWPEPAARTVPMRASETRTPTS